MKKYLYLLVCIFFCFMSACSPYKNTVNNEPEQIEIIDSGTYYRIYKGNINQVCYDIYNSDGEIVLSEKTDRPLEINMINDYRRDYSISNGASIFNDNFASAREVLYERQVAKNQHLFKLFGGNLILSKDVSYEKSVDEASEELDGMLWKSYDGGGRKQRNGSIFYNSWNGIKWK